MHYLKLLSSLSLTALLAAPVHAGDVDVDVDRSIDFEKNLDFEKNIDLSRTTTLEKSVDVNVERETNVRETFVDVARTEVQDSNNEIDVNKEGYSESFNRTTTEEKSASDSFNKSVSVDDSESYALEKSFSSMVDDSYNQSESTSDSIFASPVAEGQLEATVTKNGAGVKALGGLGPDAAMSSGASIEGGAFQNFKGINTANVNGGANSLQQSNVSISVVSTNSF